MIGADLEKRACRDPMIDFTDETPKPESWGIRRRGIRRGIFNISMILDFIFQVLIRVIRVIRAKKSLFVFVFLNETTTTTSNPFLTRI